MTNQFFETVDYSVAAALLTSSEVKLVDVIPNGHRGYALLLSPLKLCQELAGDYELNRLVCPAKLLSNNVRAVKNFIKMKTERGNWQ